MGCDIHLHQEVKINGVWYHYRHHSVDRSYKLFTLMADVRNSGELKPISSPKGLPENITFLTRYDWEVNEDQDGHSLSWLSSKEVSEVIKQFFKKDLYDAEEWFGYLFGHSWLALNLYPESMPEGLEDFRFVFWFDN